MHAASCRHDPWEMSPDHDIGPVARRTTSLTGTPGGSAGKFLKIEDRLSIRQQTCVIPVDGAGHAGP